MPVIISFVIFLPKTTEFNIPITIIGNIYDIIEIFNKLDEFSDIALKYVNPAKNEIVADTNIKNNTL